MGSPLSVNVLDTRQYRSARAPAGCPLDLIAARGLVNTIVITGDVHQNFVRNVPPDSVRLDAEPVATEFIGTSVSTGGDRTIATNFGGDANNPHLRFQDNHHGYVRCVVTPDL